MIALERAGNVIFPSSRTRVKEVPFSGMYMGKKTPAFVKAGVCVGETCRAQLDYSFVPPELTLLQSSGLPLSQAVQFSFTSSVPVVFR